jgi:hypothetical protein
MRAPLNCATLRALLVVLVLLDPARPSARADDHLAWSSPGPYTSADDAAAAGFGADQRLVVSFLFYWFDAPQYREQVAIRGFDPYPYHPTDLETMSYRDPAWYERQLGDMLEAGIDAALPVYWGQPGQFTERRVSFAAPGTNEWSGEGLGPLVEGADRLLLRRGAAPRIGMFFDTTILADADLTTERGRDVFYATIRDFYSRIPPRHRATIGGRPIVWLYDAQRVSRFDQSTFDAVDARFPRDFGGQPPYIVRERQWARAKNVGRDEPTRTGGLYAWGAAAHGFNPDPALTVAQVGPGFDSTRLLSRQERLFTDRRGGAFYEEQLERAVASGRQILAIETWNELGEGTGILETREFGRRYIDLTRRYADQFKVGLHYGWFLLRYALVTGAPGGHLGCSLAGDLGAARPLPLEKTGG